MKINNNDDFCTTVRLNLNSYLELSGTSNVFRITNEERVAEGQDVENLDYAINNLTTYYTSCEENSNLLSALDNIIYNHVSCINTFNKKGDLLCKSIYFDVPKGIYNMIIEHSAVITPELKEKKLKTDFEKAINPKEIKMGF